MTKITFIAGMRGVGKSTLLEEYENYAIIIDAEDLQSKAVELAAGDFADSYSWKHWDDIGDQETETRLRNALEDFHAIYRNNLASADVPLLVAGSILIKSPFTDSLLKIIEEKFPSKIFEPQFLVLHLDEKLISRQIEKRGLKDDEKYVNNYVEIRRHRDGYLTHGDSRWIVVTGHEEIRRRIEAGFS